MFTSIGLVAGAAQATDPVLRYQADLQGDIVVLGSTLAFDCGAGVSAPAGSIASCAGQSNTSDTAPDLYWRDDTANATIKPTDARTGSTLVIPPSATIKYARLYWAALTSGPQVTADPSAIIDIPNGPQQIVVADQSWTSPYGFASHPDWFYYQSTGDVTSFVSQWGAGAFRVSDVDALALTGVVSDRSFSAWTLVVAYELKGSELRNVALFDGFTPIDPGMAGQQSAQVTLQGFLVPPGYTANMTAIAYEGDNGYTGDHFTVNGFQESDGQNPADNFYNSSRSYLGQPVSNAQDVPALSGAPGTMAGYDLDTVDVGAYLQPGDTSAQVGADSTLDIFFLGGFVTSVTTLTPNFTLDKTVVDLNGGAVVTGDVLEYTITGLNVGNDAAMSTVLTDVVGAGLKFVPGSIKLTSGSNAGAKTDVAGDDQGEFEAGTKTVRVRLGSGADSNDGGVVSVGEGFTVTFQATVTADMGQVSNQALLNASGVSGAPPKVYTSDGDPKTLGDQPTISVIYQCDTDAQCSGSKPHCDPTTHVCIGCQTDMDCKDPAHPACQADGTCGECSDTNDGQCKKMKEVCDGNQGICVVCTVGPMGDPSNCVNDPNGPVCVNGANNVPHCGCTTDHDCGGSMSGIVCDTVSNLCIMGCRGMGGNGCPDALQCTSMDSTIGQCVMGDTSSSSGAGGGDTGGLNGVNESPGEKGSCGCATPGSEPSGLGGLVGLGLALAAVRRRRASSRL